ncbi:unnamed protein product, partial [Mesorhabditis spiculigera]
MYTSYEPDKFRSGNVLPSGRLPVRAYRVRWARFFRPLYRLLQRIGSIPSFKLRLSTSWIGSIYPSPFFDMDMRPYSWYWMHGETMQAIVLNNVPVGRRQRRRPPLQIEPLVASLRHVGRCDLSGCTAHAISGIIKFLGCRPESVENNLIEVWTLYGRHEVGLLYFHVLYLPG